MKGIEFQLPYFGRISLRPEIYIISSPFAKKGEKYFQSSDYPTSLKAYKKSLVSEKDNGEVRNNIAACLLLLGDQYQAYRIFEKLKGLSKISLFNMGLACAAINSPKKGLDTLNFELKNPGFKALKGVLYHLNGDSIKAFECLCACQDHKTTEMESILYNIHAKSDNPTQIFFSRGKEKAHEAVQNYLINFFSKVSKTQLKLPRLSIIEEELADNDMVPSKKSLRKQSESAAMILKNSKLLLKRMINPPQKRLKNISPISFSPGWKCKDVLLQKKVLDVQKYFPPKITKDVGEIDVEVDVDISQYKYLAQQSLEFIESEYNASEKSVDVMYVILKNLEFFTKFKMKIGKDIIRYSSYEKFALGDIVVREGELSDFVYIILSGSIAITKSVYGNAPVIVKTAYDGDVIGEYSFTSKNIEPLYHQGTCTASESCHVVKISNFDLSKIFDSCIAPRLL